MNFRGDRTPQFKRMLKHTVLHPPIRTYFFKAWHIFWDNGYFWILFSHLTLAAFRWKISQPLKFCFARLFHAYRYPLKGKWNPFKNFCSVNRKLFPCTILLTIVAVFASQVKFLSDPFKGFPPRCAFLYFLSTNKVPSLPEVSFSQCVKNESYIPPLWCDQKCFWTEEQY